MADFWIDEDGQFYYINSATQLLREDGKMLFKITPSVPTTPQVGNPIGLLLSLTYTS